MTTTRRGFLGSAAGALGAGLVAGCSRRLPRYLVPHTAPPDDAVPGVARYYRTICRACPAACGVTARVLDGRALKLEGSPDHPVNRGALCPRGQAAIEGLYAPDRLARPRSPAGEASWDQAERTLVDGIRRALEGKQRVVVLTRPERGSLGTLFRAWLTALGQPASQVVTFDPMERAWLREGNRRAFGTDATPIPDLASARLLLSIGDDFVEDGSPVEHAGALADMRAAGGRFVYVGPRLSLTAAAADEWLSAEPGSEVLLVLGLARLVLERVTPDPAVLPAALAEVLRTRLAAYDLAGVAARTGIAAAVIERLARALVEERPSLCLGPGRVVAGDNAPMFAEAVAVLNAAAGNLGRTLRFVAAPPAPWTGPSMDLAELGRLAAAGEVGALIVHHANPRGFGAALASLATALDRVPFVATFGNYLDETAQRAHLALPDHHFLEAWSDASPRAGITGIQQPVMSPLLPTRAAADELLAIARALGKTSGLPDGAFADSVRQAFDEKDIERGGHFSEVAFETAAALSEGVLAAAAAPLALPGPADGLPLVVAPSLRHEDGLPARSTLLNELPDPLSSISWSGWVELAPATAAGLGVERGDLVSLEAGHGRVELPAQVTPGIREGLVAVPVGYAHALGHDGPTLGLTTRVRVQRTGAQARVPQTAGGRSQRGRELARRVATSPARRLPIAPAPSLYPPVEHPVHRWGLAIDLDRCNGCGACTAACYVENNIPVVGIEEVARGRDMSWLRVQSFVELTTGATEASFLPVMCQQCTNAPCESVCPTYATYHTSEGLNAQVYPRCVGTRYCENNCPYEVRRFNYFDWPREAPTNLRLNPDVTVRERGVTEKCSFCVQRIRAGKEQAKVEGRAVRDGDVVTACVATCPARAMVFGDLNDPASEVSSWAKDGRAYHLLGELNTQPGTVYLARRSKRVGR